MIGVPFSFQFSELFMNAGFSRVYYLAIFGLVSIEGNSTHRLSAKQKIKPERCGATQRSTYQKTQILPNHREKLMGILTCPLGNAAMYQRRSTKQTRFGARRSLLLESLEHRQLLSGFSYLDFSDPSNLTMLGYVSTTPESVLRLSPAQNTTRGNVWHSEKQFVSVGFESSFDFRITGGDNSGFAFIIQNEAADSLSRDAGLGHGSVANSLAVEFDTFFHVTQGDPNDNHIAINTNGTGYNRSGASFTRGTASPPFDLNDGATHNALVRYVPGTLSVFLDGNVAPALTVGIDIANTLDLDLGRAWIGFGASSKDQYDDILNWNFQTAVDTTQSIGVSNTSRSEGSGGFTSVEFTITRLGDLSNETLVNWVTLDGSAIAGTDYVSASGQVTFAVGQATAAVTVSVRGDELVEGNETFNLILSVQGGSAILADGIGVATILNDDVSISIADTNAYEGSNAWRFVDEFVSRVTSTLWQPLHATFGPDGDLFVGSRATDEVHRFDGETGAFLGVFAAPVPSLLDDPRGMAFGPDGNFYVACFDGRVRRFNGTTGAYIDDFVKAGSGGLANATGLEFGPDGNLYVSNRLADEVLRFNGITGQFMDAFIPAGNGVINPFHMVFHGGSLYVTSVGTNEVVRYNATTGANMGAFVASGNGGLNAPQDVAFGPDGDLYVSSLGNDSVFRYNGTTGAFIEQVASNTNGGLFRPQGLVFGSAGMLYVIGEDDWDQSDADTENPVLRYGSQSLAVVPVSLSAPAGVPVTVTYSVVSGTATSGSDFVDISGGSITFLPGETVKSIIIQTSDDSIYEGNETFFVNLANPTSGIIADGQGVVTIIDNEAPPTLFYDSFEVGEWNGLWVEDIQNDWFRSTQRATDGSWSAEVDGSATNATLATANAIDLSGVGESTLTFDWLIESGFDAGEYLALDISTNGGASWTQDVRRLNGNVSQEDVWHSETVDLTPYTSANLKVRFRSKVSASDEDADVDNMRIVGVPLGPNTPPVANAGGPYIVNEGSSIVLSGAGSGDPDGTIASYAWDYDGDGQYDDAAGVAPSFAQTNSGSYFVGLRVTDNRGATSTTTASITVNNVAPTANAGSDQNGSVGAPVSLSASGSSDPGNDIVGYAWDLDNDGQYDDASGVSASFTATAVGTYTIGLQVTDADGAVSTDSATITITQTLSTKFYVLNDATTNRTYEYDAMGGAIENYAINSGNSAPRGAASTAAGTTVWVADKNRKVFVYDTAGGLQGSWTAGTLNSKSQVEGLATNGSDVWIVDNRTDTVYRYTGAAGRTSGSQNAASSFPLNSSNTNPKGIVTDGTYLWVVNDSSTDKVFKYSLSGSLVGSWTIDSANQLPTGLTIDPTNGSQSIWIVDSGTDKVYEYASARGTTSGSLSATVTFSLASGNSNPQGIADPPAPGSRLDAAKQPAVPSVSGMAPPLDSNRPNPVADVRRSDEQPKALNRSEESYQLLNRFTASSLETTRYPLTPPSGSHQLPMAGNIDETDDVFSLDDPFGPLDESLLGLLAHQR